MVLVATESISTINFRLVLSSAVRGDHRIKLPFTRSWSQGGYWPWLCGHRVGTKHQE
jgi:hypothetical protein